MTLRMHARTTAFRITLVAALALFPMHGTAVFAQDPQPGAPQPATQEPAAQEPAAQQPAADAQADQPADVPLESADDQAALADVALTQDQVQALQEALKDLGYFYGPADGRKGPRT